MKDEFNQKWRKKVLASSINFLLITLIVLLFIIVACSPDSGKDSSKGLVKISNVTKEQSINIATSGSDSSISGLTIHCRGYIDGKATLRASNWEPKILSGNIDWHIYHDWFFATCIIKYMPENVKSGNLIIEYEFH